MPLSSHERRHIAELAEKINPTYQETWAERDQINEWEWENDLDFSILGLIDVNTTYIAGYASQIATNGKVRNPEEAMNELQTIQFFDEPYFANWYFSADNQYLKVKSYVELLDYLRLSALQYISLHQNAVSFLTNGSSMTTNGTSMNTNGATPPTLKKITAPHKILELEMA